MFLVNGDVSITGTGVVDASAISTTTSGPGGDLSCGTSQGGNETATGTCPLNGGAGGGGGGGFGTDGGKGGTGDTDGSSTVGSVAGVSRGASTLSPLLGGCRGGNGDTGVAAGRGAGAFQISAGGSLTMSGTVRANGGTGSDGCGTEGSGAGGGSGGGILLEGGTYFVTGTTQANGGNGGASAWSGGSNAAGSSSSASAGTNGASNLGGGNGGGGGYGRVRSQAATSGTGMGTAACPSDTFLMAGTVCRAFDSSGCDNAAETCSGSSAACPADNPKPAGTGCRVAAGTCDVAETCNGVSNACPTDTFVSAGTVCRAIAERVRSQPPRPAPAAAPRARPIRGSPRAPRCAARRSARVMRPRIAPAAAVRVRPTLSRRAALSAACRPGCAIRRRTARARPTRVRDTISPAGTVCRAAGGACDVVETCAGGTPNCPGDALVSAGTVCRPIASSCDLVAETCTGSAAACPADASFAAAGTVCRAVGGTCDVAEACSGSSGSCPVDSYTSSGTQCRASAGVCDVAENCSGSSNACPADAFVASGTVCRAIAGTCDSAAETCSGSSAGCPADTSYASSTTLCRAQTGICDAGEFCTGSSTTCPGDAYAPYGTDCGYTGGANAVTVYSTGLPSGTNANVSDFATSPSSGYTTTGSNPSSATLSTATVSGWGSDAYKFAVTAPAGAAYDYWRWVAGNGTASGSSRALQTPDMIEYDVYIDSNIDGIGGIDVKTSHASTATTGCAGTCDYFRGWTEWTSQNGHPSANISGSAYRTWAHRRLTIPSGMAGSTITYFDAVDENNSSGTRAAYYDNLIITQTAGSCDGANVCKVKDSSACSTNSDCASGLCQSVSLDASAVHRWALAGSGTTLTDSIGTSNGTLSGTTLSSGTAVLGGGTSGPYLDFPNHVLNVLTNATVEVWLTYGGGAAWQRVFDFGDSGSEGNQGTGDSYWFMTPNNGSAARLAYKRSGVAEVNITAPSVMASSVLTQVVGVFDDANDTMTFYINGTSMGSLALGTGDHLSGINDINPWIGRIAVQRGPRARRHDLRRPHVQQGAERRGSARELPARRRIQYLLAPARDRIELYGQQRVHQRQLRG